MRLAPKGSDWHNLAGQPLADHRKCITEAEAGKPVGPAEKSHPILALSRTGGALTSSGAAGILAVMRIPAGPLRLMLALLLLLVAHPAATRARGLVLPGQRD